MDKSKKKLTEMLIFFKYLFWNMLFGWLGWLVGNVFYGVLTLSMKFNAE